MSKYSDKVKRRLEEAKNDCAKEATKSTPIEPAAPKPRTGERLTPAEQSARDRAAYLDATKDERARTLAAVMDALGAVQLAADNAIAPMIAASGKLDAALGLSSGLVKNDLHSLCHMAARLREDATRLVARCEIAKAVADMVLACRRT